MLEYVHYPPLIVTHRCPICPEEEHEIVVAGWTVGGDPSTFKAEIIKAGCPHIRRCIEECLGDPPYIVWGGRSGYAVAPEGVVGLFCHKLGYRYAAPLGRGYVCLLGRVHDDLDAIVGIELTEEEYLYLTSPAHYPCGEKPPRFTMEWLKERLRVGLMDCVCDTIVFLLPLRPLEEEGGEEGGTDNAP